ncbi:hypothetical protein SGPA1_40008 [Streptomyces misionensis JCM 4497]
MDLAVQARSIVPRRCLNVLVDLSAVAHNTRVVRQAVSRPATAVMAVVKAGGPAAGDPGVHLDRGVPAAQRDRSGADSAARLSPGEATGAPGRNGSGPGERLRPGGRP